MVIKEELNTIKEFLKNNSTLILALLLMFTAASNIYFYNRFSDLRDNPQKAVQEETQRLITKVSELITLPKDEQPTIATVSDPEQLKDQPFFANAKKGDKVLIYASAGKTILYNPTANKVVEVASINIGGSTPEPTPSP